MCYVAATQRELPRRLVKYESNPGTKREFCLSLNFKHPPCPEGTPHTSPGQRPGNLARHSPAFCRNAASARITGWSPVGGRQSNQSLCGVPSERLKVVPRRPRVASWAGMRRPVGALVEMSPFWDEMSKCPKFRGQPQGLPLQISGSRLGEDHAGRRPAHPGGLVPPLFSHGGKMGQPQGLPLQISGNRLGEDHAGRRPAHPGGLVPVNSRLKE